MPPKTGSTKHTLKHALNGLLVCVLLICSFPSAIAFELTRQSVLDHLQTYGTEDGPLSANIHVQRHSASGKGGDRISSQASFDMGVSYKKNQLSTHYSKTLLHNIGTEAKAHEQDANFPTPIQNAVSRLNVRKIQSITSAHEVLIRRLNKSTLMKQEQVQYKGSPAILMTFNVKPEFSKRDKKYIKKTQATLKLWLTKEGVPLACETFFTMKGSAFIVIRFKSKETKTIEYQTHKNRLLASYIKSTYNGSGGGEVEESTTTTQLTIDLGATKGLLF